MKKTLLLLLLSSPFFQNIYSQNYENKDITDAVNFLNIFLNEENWSAKITGGFTYNNYSKTLLYKSKSVGKDEKKTTIDDNYIFSLKNVIKITEKIHKADKNNSENSNLMAFDILLKDEIYRSLYIQKKGDTIPDYKNKKVRKVWFAIEKNITDEDVENLKLAIREIFQNIPVETEYF